MSRKLPPHARLQHLRAELERLESDMASSNYANSTSSDDPEALLRGLTEIRQRLHTLSSSTEMRTSQKLLSRVTSSASSAPAFTTANGAESGDRVRNEQSTSDAENISSLDRRLGELEIAVGASNAALDEVGYFMSFTSHRLNMLFGAVLPVAPAPPSTYYKAFEYLNPLEPAKTNRRHISTPQAPAN
jgi:hypothetical protein